MTVCIEGHVMHRDLRGESRGLGQVQTLLGRHMAYVDRLALEMSRKTRYRIPFGFRRSVAHVIPAAALLILRYQMIVLGVDAQAPSRRESVPDRWNELLVVVQKDVARGGAHEELETHDIRG